MSPAQKKRIKKLSPEDRAAFFSAVRMACYYLASCWDELSTAENLIDGEIEADDIQGLASDLDHPPNTEKLTDKIILEGL